MTMTAEQGSRLRVLLQEAFDLVLGRRIGFALAIKDEDSLDIVTNMNTRQGAGELLKRAALITRSEPDGQIDLPDHRATGESAGAHEAPGMECGHVAPLGGATSDGEPPAVATELERCWRRIPPAFAEQCPHDATGGVRLKLFPTLSIQKRYGKRSLFELVLDLPVCPACFGQMSAEEVLKNLEPNQWQAFMKVAQQRNNGVLPIRENSEILHIPFSDPEYALLRRESAKRRNPAASNESQAPATAPEKG